MSEIQNKQRAVSHRARLLAFPNGQAILSAFAAAVWRALRGGNDEASEVEMNANDSTEFLLDFAIAFVLFGMVILIARGC